MSGIGSVFNIAKNALLTQRYALDVTSHNISNVSTEGYTRQSSIINAKDAAPYGGFLFGTGVEINEIYRNTNSFIETRLQDGKTDLSSMSEQELYMNVMETIFNETSEMSLSNQIADFWNAWNDVSNNPSGIPERQLLSDYSELLSEGFKNVFYDLEALDTELGNSIDSGIQKINEILVEIADLNQQIIVVEIQGNGNDLRDQRNLLVTELSEYIDINSYEYEDGNLTVTTGQGHILVSRSDSYTLEFDGNDVNWQNSAGVGVAITDTVNGGKLGGWLEMRDKIIPKFNADINELAKTNIWEINKIHSQGIGLNGFTSVTGTYETTSNTGELGTVNSGLDFYDGITDGSFKIWLYDPTGTVVGATDITVDADTTSIEDLASAINSVSIGSENALNSIISDGKLHIEVDTGSGYSGYTFAFSDDTSNALAALGINTFFEGSSSNDISVNDTIILDKNFVSAALINNNVGSPVGSAGNTSTGIITSAGPYTGSSDAIYEIEITTDGTTFQWRKDGGSWSADTSIAASPSIGSEGVAATFNGNFIAGDTFTINVQESTSTYGGFSPGDNTNSLAVVDLQYQDIAIKQWTYERGEIPLFADVTGSTMDDYLHMLVGSVGIKSQSIQRESEYKGVIVNELQAIRDNFSGVSIDEEMTNIIKYQHAYSAAAKLITTAEEMLETLLNTI